MNYSVPFLALLKNTFCKFVSCKFVRTDCLFLNMVDSFYALFFNTYLPIRI